MQFSISLLPFLSLGLSGGVKDRDWKILRMLSLNETSHSMLLWAIVCNFM